MQADLKKANQKFVRLYPGDSTARQPVHTVYGGAHLFKAETARKIGDVALNSLSQFAPNSKDLWTALGLTHAPEFRDKIYSRILEKLKREPVEDFRIDFEDGYGSRAGEEEDGHAISAAEELARGNALNSLPPFIGVRIKSFTNELFDRSSRTLELFMNQLLKKTRGKVPAHFVVTLPKVTLPEQVSALVRLLENFEKKHKLEKGILKLEIMVETPQSLFNSRGEAALPALVAAAKGRCRGAHFGAYDYTAACNITSAHQTLLHPACDFARNMMQVTLAGTGVTLSDGATNIMPVGSREDVHRAWKVNYEHIQNSWSSGFFQGWDLHPAQVPVRYAAIYTFFLENLEPTSLRLKSFMAKAAQANRVGTTFDDAATGQGLLNFFIRGVSCGAISEDEAQTTGLTIEEIRGRSFHQILKR